MNDFLSNFNSDNYGSATKEKVELEGKVKLAHATTQEPRRMKERVKTSRHKEEGVEIDPAYQKKKRKKIISGVVFGVVFCVGCFFVYGKLSHVEMPYFKNEEVSDVILWAETNEMRLLIEQEYSLEYDVNKVTAQSVDASAKIKQGSEISTTVSIGPDPDEVISFPDFRAMTLANTEEWIKDNKAENISIVQEYSEDIEKGEFIRQKISDKEITPLTYRRKDRATIYYSKGFEMFEKNIVVPNFTGKTKETVESWAKTNEIVVTYEEVASKDIAFGMIVSQSVSEDTKMAKKEIIRVQTSLGKPIIVPDFRNYSINTAAGVIEEIAVQAKEMYSMEVEYGEMISQSVLADTELTDKDDKNITVVYSCGRPYLRSYIGELEGDLPKLFYNDYISKGADIKYKLYEIDSHEERGKVVQMSAYNQYVDMNYVVNIVLSRGNLQPPENAES